MKVGLRWKKPRTLERPSEKFKPLKENHPTCDKNNRWMWNPFGDIHSPCPCRVNRCAQQSTRPFNNCPSCPLPLMSFTGPTMSAIALKDGDSLPVFAKAFPPKASKLNWRHGPNNIQKLG